MLFAMALPSILVAVIATDVLEKDFADWWKKEVVLSSEPRTLLPHLVEDDSCSAAVAGVCMVRCPENELIAAIEPQDEAPADNLVRRRSSESEEEEEVLDLTLPTTAW